MKKRRSLGKCLLFVTSSDSNNYNVLIGRINAFTKIGPNAVSGLRPRFKKMWSFHWENLFRRKCRDSHSRKFTISFCLINSNASCKCWVSSQKLLILLKVAWSLRNLQLPMIVNVSASFDKYLSWELYKIHIFKSARSCIDRNSFQPLFLPCFIHFTRKSIATPALAPICLKQKIFTVNIASLNAKSNKHRCK